MLMIREPYKKKRIDMGNLGIEKYSDEYYRLLWKYGYKNGKVKPMINNITAHRNIINEFDKNFGYSYYDKRQKKYIPGRDNKNKRYYVNHNSFKKQ